MFRKTKEYQGVYRCNIKIKLLPNHYYIPVVLSESEKIDYIQHIIKVKSEVEFLNELENYLNKENNFFKEFDWWYFSKIDETIDRVYIPYYNPKTNRIDKFKPDFIFWLKKGDDYIILFVDPKGTVYTDGNRKIDGYLRIFEPDVNGKNMLKTFDYNGYKVKVNLLLYNKTNLPEDKYKNYWINSIENMVEKIKELLD